MLHVQRVACAGVIHVVPRRVGHAPVVAHIVDAFETQRRPEMIALRGVVIDHVHDDLDARRVKLFHHAFELRNLLPRRATRRVTRFRREVADGGVTPVVSQPAFFEKAVVHEMMHRQHLDRRDAELLEIGNRLARTQPRVSAAQLFRQRRPQLREAFDMHLVNDGLRHRAIDAPVA